MEKNFLSVFCPQNEKINVISENGKIVTVENDRRNIKKENEFLLNEDFIKWRLFRTEELEDQWSDFRSHNQHLEQSLDEAVARFDALKMNRISLPDRDKDRIYQSVLQEVDRYERRRRRWLKIGQSAAAAVLLACIFSVTLFVMRDGQDSSHDGPADGVMTDEMLRGEGVYIQSGEQKVNIINNSHIELTKDAKALVIAADSAADGGKEMLLSATALNKLVVPYGKRSNLALPDGTKIKVNSGTKVEFPAQFKGNTREIYVSGEIFIDVAKDLQKTFIVHTPDMDIHVCGTSFNVSAYNDDAKKTVVLVNGKIKIKTPEGGTSLLPNEKADLEGSNITKEKVDVSEYVSWTNGIFEFNKAPMSDILKRIGRYYNVRFESSNDMILNDKTYSGKLFLSDNLDSVMVSISSISSTAYRRENSIIHINKK